MTKENKKPNNWIITLILIFVALIAGSIVKEISKDIGRSAANNINVKSGANEVLESDEFVNAMLKNTSEKLNKQCPIKIDKYTTALGALPFDRKVIYRYQLDINKLIEDSNTDLTTLENTIKQNMITNFRSNPSFDTFKKHDVEMEYQYTDLDGKFLFKFVINKSLTTE
ncbi:MAG: hypothetical protein ISS71_06755 [Phycisphaerae bacterium]|nr:hypothetical protein [Phycisphaerae bacterium]